MGKDRRVTLLTRRQFLVGVAAAGAATGFARETGAAAETITLPVTIAEAGRRLRAGLLTAEALTRAYLACIGQLNPKLNAFITVTQEYALRTASVRDLELRAGKDRGPLHGVPIVVKDAYDTVGIKTTAGSEFFKDRVPTEDATVVARLKAAGAIIVGKTNMNEFGFGILGQNTYYGDAHNPWDLSRSPGGSSSGTAAALAAGLCLGGVGADGGGSIRIPSAWCGLVGIRPTHGRVSLKGAFLAGGSLGCAGPLARTAADLALLLTAMAGYDPRDPRSLNVPGEDYAVGLGRGIRGVKLGIIDDYTFRDADPEIASAVRAAADRLAGLGPEIVNVKIPLWSGPLDIVYKPFSTIANYDTNQLLGEQYRAAPDKNSLGPRVQAAIAAGEKITKATYEQALADRSMQSAQVKAVFNTVDALLTPTFSVVAPPLTLRQDTPAADVFRNRGNPFMIPFGFIGLPSMSVPCGFDRSGMPIGLQIVGNSLQDALLLRIAAAYEAATEWHTRRPPLFCSHAS